MNICPCYSALLRSISRWTDMRAFAAIAFSCIPLLAGSAHAVQCASPGSLNVLRANDGSAFVFYPSRSYGDTVFVLPGKEFRKDERAPQGARQFFVDGIHYEFLTIAKSQFTGDRENSDDAAILARHARYEHAYVLKVGGPLTGLEELGNRHKPASDGNPPFVFKLWLLKNPKEPSGVRQYYLTTVVGDEVATLSAIVIGPEYEDQAIAAFTKFASSFQFIPSEKMCPPKALSGSAQQVIPTDIVRQSAPSR